MAAEGGPGEQRQFQGSGHRVRASLSASSPERRGLTRLWVRGARYGGREGFGSGGLGLWGAWWVWGPGWGSAGIGSWGVLGGSGS